MPFTDTLAARDEMFRLFAEAWATVAVDGNPVEVRWQGKEKGEIPRTYFVRISTNNVGQPNAGFLQNGDGQSRQVYEPFGNLFVQVFSPMSEIDSHRKGELLAITARNIFRSTETAGGVWFRNARYTETGNDGVHYGWKVTVDFEFSEV